MKLGDRVQISIGVPDLAEAKALYTALGFAHLAEAAQPWPWAQFTDGQNLVLLNQDGNRYVGLLYFAEDAVERIRVLEHQGIAFLAAIDDQQRLQTAVTTDPNGHMVGVVNQAPAGMPQPDGTPLTKCGKFGEYAVAVADFDASLAFWRTLGFEPLFTSNDGYPWGIISDGLIMVGLHQTTDFTGPCMTYFAADMPRRIQELEQSGLVIENGILKTPWGQVIFLFEGDI